MTARKVGESVTTALDVMATAINYPIGNLFTYCTSSFVVVVYWPRYILDTQILLGLP